MIQKVDKIFYQKRTICLSVPWNVLPSKVIADIITYWCNNMSFDINDSNKLGTIRLCCITDRVAEYIVYTLNPEDFDDFNINKSVEVSVFPIWEFTATTIDQELHKKLIDNFDLYAIGYINTMNDDVMIALRRMFPWQNFILFGDPTVDAPEYDNRFARYLSNSSIEIKDTFDLGKISKLKKINDTLRKLRQNDDESAFKKITSSGPVKINSVSNYNIDDIMNYIKEPNTYVCVPRRIYSQVINEIWYDSGRSSDLNQQVGDVFYVKYPYIGTDEKGVLRIVMPMQKVKFSWIDNNALSVDGHQCFLAHGYIMDNEDNELFYLENIVYDHSDYLLGFDNSNYQYDNTEDFEICNSLVRSGRYRNLGNEVMCILPFKIVFPELTKYFTCDKMVAYIEYIERELGFRSDINWYKYICNATKEVEINYTDEFI